MAERLDALAVSEYQDRNGETRTSFTRIGVAFPLRSGEGYQLMLDAMPAPVDGQFKILCKPPREDNRQRQTDQRPLSEDLGDEIPF